MTVTTRSMRMKDAQKRLGNALYSSTRRSNNNQHHHHNGSSTLSTSTSSSSSQTIIITRIIAECPEVLTMHTLTSRSNYYDVMSNNRETDGDVDDAFAEAEIDTWCYIPLQTAIMLRCTNEIILLLANATTKSAIKQQQQGGGGPSPLHLVLKTRQFVVDDSSMSVATTTAAGTGDSHTTSSVAGNVARNRRPVTTTRRSTRNNNNSNNNVRQEQQRQVVLNQGSIYLLKEMIKLFKEDLLEPVENFFNWNYSDLPLHYALRRKLPYEVIKILVDAQRTVAQRKNGQGMLPFDIACNRSVGGTISDDDMLRQLQLLVRCYPGAATREREREVGFLRTLVQFNRCGPKSARFLLERIYPSLTEPGKWLPIQTAMQYKLPMSFIFCLCRLYPDTLRELDQHGMNAIHMFAGSKQNLACWNPLTFKKIVQWAGPTAVRVKSSNIINADTITGGGGLLPIHMLCQSDPRKDYVKILIDAYPESVRVPDDSSSGGLPLHHACRQQATKTTMKWNLLLYGEKNLSLFKLNELIQYLIRLYPGGVQYKDKNGFLPLHHACAYGQMHREIIQYLIECHPLSIRIPVTRIPDYHATTVDAPEQNEERWLPVFLAAANPKSQLETVYYLMRQYPEAISAFAK